MTTAKHLVGLSKWLSWALRHDPTAAGISLDKGGWCSIEAVLAAAAQRGQRSTRADVEEIVATSDKQRFIISGDGLLIRANQGHSLPVDLDLVAQVPPEKLYHGTADRFLAAILSQGLRRQERNHVHLSRERATAEQVGMRHGRLVMLLVEAGRMHLDGHVFFCSANGVWLVDSVPPAYLAVVP